MPRDLEYQNIFELDLSHPEYLPQLQEAFNYIYEYQLLKEAWYLRKALIQALTFPQLPAELNKTYQGMLVVLNWLALPMLPEDDVIRVLRENTFTAIKLGIDIERMMLRKIWQIPSDIFPGIAQRYLAVLRENTEQIGTAPIEVRGEIGPQPPTLGKYFTDYHWTIGDRKAMPLDILQYMNQDPDIVRLGPTERELLKRAFRFYEGLKPLSLEEIRKHLTPEEREMSQLGTLPAPTPEEREALGIPFGPTIAPPMPLRVPPVIRLERKQATPYVPPIDLKPKANQIKLPPETPVAEPPPFASSSIVPLPIAPSPEKPVAAEAKPALPVFAKQKPQIAQPQIQAATPVQPPLSTPTSQQPIPTQEQSEKEIGEYRIIRPIGGLAGREPKNINPKDTQPTLEGNIVDLKGDG